MEPTNQPQEQDVEQKVLTQKEAVIQFLNEEIEYMEVTVGMDLRDLVTKEVRAKVRAKLFNGFKSGLIKLKSDKTDQQLNKYCSGLISNWLSDRKNVLK